MTTPVPPQAPTPNTKAPGCQAFEHYVPRTKTQLQCGAPSSFTLRPRVTVGDKSSDGEPIYLCARHAGMSWQLVKA